jgi:hypothetical protein
VAARSNNVTRCTSNRVLPSAGALVHLDLAGYLLLKDLDADWVQHIVLGYSILAFRTDPNLDDECHISSLSTGILTNWFPDEQFVNGFMNTCKSSPLATFGRCDYL